MKETPLYPIQLKPEFRNYVWGGNRLQSLIEPDRLDAHQPLAEVWAVYAGNTVMNGALAGQSLAELSAQYGKDLLGKACQNAEVQFPLLIKLLDCNDWLSVQVHPDDQQARELEGVGYVGKTEAWHILDAQPNAELVAGVKSGVTRAELSSAILTGHTLNMLKKHSVQAGDTVLIRAGTIHALGPGILVYEVQQTSDITYRVYDWDRPLSAGRKLHLEQAAQVCDPTIEVQLAPLPQPQPAETILTQSAYFRLENLAVSTAPLHMDTHQESFHALTVVSGQICLECASGRLDLQPLETVLIPAVCGAYTLSGNGRLLCAALPD